jgi:shikimate dehydrogenase
MNAIDTSQSVITGATRLFAIIGDPIAQVGSPRVFNPIMFRNKADAVLVPLLVAPSDLTTAFAGIKTLRNFDGLIFTIPHKMAAMALVDEVLATGKLVGAVNVARREKATHGKNDRWVADMFDGRGCVRGLKDQGDDPLGKSVLLVGAGGGGSAVACGLAEAGARRMTICDVDRAKADRLAQTVARGFPKIPVAIGPASPKGHDLVVNCTPLGMKADDPLPLDADELAAGTILVDIVLKPDATKLLEIGKQRGCRTMGGIAMLRGQSLEVARFFGFG